MTVSERISPSEAAAIQQYLTSLPHVTGVSVLGKLVTVQVDKDRHWKDIREKVELGVHNVVEPGVPHSAAELKKSVADLRASMLGGGQGSQRAAAAGGTESSGQEASQWRQKFPGLSLLAAKSLANASPAGALPSSEAAADTEMLAFLQEACMEILTVAVNPVLERDGGSCSLASIAREAGGAGYVVKLSMKGACKGCPASTITMKAFIEKTVKAYLPEIVSVEESDDEDAKE